MDLVVGAICADTKFHIIDAEPNYHIILGRSWMHNYVVVPSSYHQCLKGIWAGKKVTVQASERSFDVHEARLFDIEYFTELGNMVQAIVSRPMRVKIPRWENIKVKKEDTRKGGPVATDSATPRKITKVREGGKVVYCL